MGFKEEILKWSTMLNMTLFLKITKQIGSKI